MNRILVITQMHLRNRIRWFFIPSLILGSSFAIMIFIGLLIGEEVITYSGAIASIYVYMFTFGITTLHDTFPFALGFSMRRTDYFLGTLLTVITVNVVWAAILFLLSFTENDLTGGWGIGLHFFHTPYISDGPLMGQLWVYFIALVHMYLLGFAIGSVYQRFGPIGIYAFSISAFLLSIAGTSLLNYLHWWGHIFASLAQYSALGLALWMVPVISGYGFVAYLLLRKATI